MLEYRRRLPHFQPDGVPVFPTCRLHGTLPACAVKTLHASPGKAFVSKDRTLDCAAVGPRWLEIPSVARMIAETILYGEGNRRFYELDAWVVMPNHVHLLLTPDTDLPTITRWLKGSTARKANQILGLTGQPFWQDESWDRWVRSGDEFRRIIRYIHENPVSAGLASAAERWEWSSAYVAGESACPT